MLIYIIYIIHFVFHIGYTEIVMCAVKYHRIARAVIPLLKRSIVKATHDKSPALVWTPCSLFLYLHVIDPIQTHIYSIFYPGCSDAHIPSELTQRMNSALTII